MIDANNRLVIFGGTFDPIHNGHVQLSTYLAKSLNSPITFMPNNIPPYKSPPVATNKQRLDMLNLVISQNKLFKLDTRELYSNTYNYTYQTLQNIRHEYGNNIPIFFVMGEDSMVTFDTWENYYQILEMTNLIIINRVGYNLTQLHNKKLMNYINHHTITDLKDLNSKSGNIYRLDYTPDGISSTYLRKLLQTNTEHDLIKSMLPKEIYDYIINNHIYQTPTR